MTDKNLSDFEEITDVTFDHEGAHLAVCHKSQSGSANGWHTSLLLKSSEAELTEDIIKALHQVTVKLSFEEFLTRFFDMYSSDAEVLAKMLGFTTEYEDCAESEEIEEYRDTDWYQEWLQPKLDKVEILRSASKLADISADDLLDIISIQKAFEKGLEQFQAASPQEAQSEIIKSTEDEGTQMDIQELMKSAEVQDFITAEITKAVDAANAGKDAEIEAIKEELTKAAEAKEAAEAELTTFREAKAQARKEGITNFVKSLSFVAEEKAEEMVEAIFKAADIEGVKVIVDALEDAQAAIVKAKEDFLQEEAGVEVKEETVDVNKAVALADALASKYAGKKFI